MQINHKLTNPRPNGCLHTAPNSPALPVPPTRASFQGSFPGQVGGGKGACRGWRCRTQNWNPAEMEMPLSWVAISSGVRGSPKMRL